MQACSPFVHCPTLLGRQTGGGLCQSPTDLKLPPCPLQPRVEVGTVALVGDHSARNEFFWCRVKESIIFAISLVSLWDT